MEKKISVLLSARKLAETFDGIKCPRHISVKRIELRQGTTRLSPRAFPLGLLAPICLGALLILAIRP